MRRQRRKQRSKGKDSVTGGWQAAVVQEKERMTVCESGVSSGKGRAQGSRLRVGHDLRFVPSSPARQQSRLAQFACDVKLHYMPT